MILGIGTDITNIERINVLMIRFGDRFLNKVFNESERQKADTAYHAAAAYAKRWAAKEACFKALSAGSAMHGDTSLNKISWRHMTIDNAPTGHPQMNLQKGALHCLKSMTPSAHFVRIHVTLSDDPPFAQAYIVIEALPIKTHEQHTILSNSNT